MELGLQNRVFVVVAPDPVDRDACGDALAAEGAQVVQVDRLDAADEVVRSQSRLDGVVVYLPITGGSELLSIDAAGLLEAWTPVEAVAAAFRSALPLMTDRGWGRLVSVVSGAVKWLSEDSDERAAVAGLAVLGLHKAVVADVARFGITTNAVLRDASSDPREVADTVTFLLSEPAAYLQGVTVGLDGAHSTSVF
jgi:NAD(P)-dependent dehydrogenase (short-subunit alcohol dehydrogenase family)